MSFKTSWNNFIYKYIKPFFFSSSPLPNEADDARVKPIFVWSTLFLSLTVAVVGLQIYLVFHSVTTGQRPPLDLSMVIGILAGTTVSLIATYNVAKRNSITENSINNTTQSAGQNQPQAFTTVSATQTNATQQSQSSTTPTDSNT